MAGFNRFGVYPARFGDIALNQIMGTGVRPASTKTEKIVGGDVDRSAVITAYADPMITCRTCDFDGLFAGGNVVSITAGYAVDVIGAGTAATLVQHQKRIDGGTFVAAGNAEHYQLGSDKGFLLIDEISAEQDSITGAEVSLQYYALSDDGINEPIVPGLAALVNAPAFSGQWYLGPVLLGDLSGAPTQLAGVQRISIRPGLQYQHKRADGVPFACIGSIVARKPEIRVTVNTLDTAAFSTLFHNATTEANGLAGHFYFQKGVHGGSRIAKNVANHYRVDAATGDATFESFEVRELDDTTSELIFRPTGTLALAANVVIVIA